MNLSPFTEIKYYQANNSQLMLARLMVQKIQMDYTSAVEMQMKLMIIIYYWLLFLKSLSSYITYHSSNQLFTSIILLVS